MTALFETRYKTTTLLEDHGEWTAFLAEWFTMTVVVGDFVWMERVMFTTLLASMSCARIVVRVLLSQLKP